MAGFLRSTISDIWLEKWWGARREGLNGVILELGASFNMVLLMTSNLFLRVLPLPQLQGMSAEPRESRDRHVSSVSAFNLLQDVDQAVKPAWTSVSTSVKSVD